MKLKSFGPWAAPLSALIAFAAFPPFNLLFLALVALAPWLAYLRECTPRQARRSGFVFGLVFWGAQMFWVDMFVSDWVHKPVMGLIPWVVATLLGAPFYSLTGALIHRCWVKNWPWAIPLVWGGCEILRVNLPALQFPWAILALPLARIPALVQGAALGTVYLVSAWAVLGSLIAAILMWPPEQGSKVREVPGQIVSRLIMVYVAFMLVPGVRMLQPQNLTTKTFTLGQPGVDMAFTKGYQRQYELSNAGSQLLSAAIAQKSNLLILPEGFGETTDQDHPDTVLGDSPQVPVMLGAHRQEGSTYYQSAFAFDGKWQHADKTRLVVFGEYVPFRDSIPALKSFNLPSGDLSPAKTLTTPTVAGMKLGPLICFEGVFAELAEAHQKNGAQALVQMSIDDWYEKTPAHEQLALSSIWRSIESGLPLLRVGGRGTTLATNSRGQVIARAPIGPLVPLHVEVGLPQEGDGFPFRMEIAYALALFAALMLAENAWARWRREGDSNP